VTYPEGNRAIVRATFLKVNRDLREGRQKLAGAIRDTADHISSPSLLAL
jgi:hypothetical protein